jgi:tRNA(Arg) A34 adenosine deaminase TadA
MKTLEPQNLLEIALMKRTVQLSLDRVRNGGIPFSALVVDEQGNVLGEGVNQVNILCDPCAHDEIMAIREAGKKSGNANLAGKTLYASGEPCALCYLAAKWAGITNIFVASDRHEAAMAGFDYRWSYHFINEGVPSALMQVKKLSVAGANVQFKRWEELSRKA